MKETVVKSPMILQLFYTLFGKLIEHEYELKRLKASEANMKKIVKEEKRSISLKASSSKDKVKDDEDNSIIQMRTLQRMKR